MQALAVHTGIKLNIQHNISSNKIIQARFDLSHTILATKQNIQARYGSFVQYMKLQLKDAKGNFLKDLQNDIYTLGQYGVENGMIIYVLDLNPNSIHKEIQNLQGVQKYVLSQEDYDKLPESFRKWKKQFLKKHPQFLKQNHGGLPLEVTDPQYLGQLASTIQIGTRCKLQSGFRGKIQFVGKIFNLGGGYWIGIKLDEPLGDSDGKINGVKYFQAGDKYGTFVRPNQIQIGDFPQLSIDDQI